MLLGSGVELRREVDAIRKFLKKVYHKLACYGTDSLSDGVRFGKEVISTRKDVLIPTFGRERSARCESRICFHGVGNGDPSRDYLPVLKREEDSKHATTEPACCDNGCVHGVG